MTAPQGSISKAVDNLRVTLADSAAFRSWVGAVDQATALVKIYYESLPPPADKNEHTFAELVAYRPYALVWTVPDSGFALRHDAHSGLFVYNESGLMMIRLIQAVDAGIANDPAEISRQFLNTVGTILDQLAAKAGGGGYLAIEEMELDFGPYRGDPDERSTQGDYVGADVKLSWGTGGT